MPSEVPLYRHFSEGQYVRVYSYSLTSFSIAGMDGYRPMYIPGDIATRFQEVAGANTLRNVETCGILAGKLVKGHSC